MGKNDRPFSGFSPETFDFLWGIRMNNDRDWFQAHKQQYVDELYEPMKALGKELFRPFLDMPGMVLKVSRIYRDARLHHPLPYKESLWICIRRQVEEWSRHPCLYFQITPEGADYGLFFWQPTSAWLEAFRQDIAARPEEFLKTIRDTEQAVGRKVDAQCYKRPKPAPDPRLAPYYGWRGQIDCTRVLTPGPALFSPDLKDQVGDFFAELTPLYQYLDRIDGER